MNEYKDDKLINMNNPGFREFKFDTKIEFVILADCMDAIYEILCEIASLKININAYSYNKIDKNTVMMRIIIDLEDQSKPNIYAVKEILKDFNVKFTIAEVLRAIFLDDNVGGYAILLNTINKISTVEYSYILHDGSAILGVESLKKVMNALKHMVYK